jgi:RecQ family ATP-dependent DNA helicase
MTTAIQTACETLGWPQGLRPLQAEVMDAIMAGDDVMAVLATGGGKSGLYQVPALARPGLVVVVSPLIALMLDQQQRLEAHGVAVGSLHSQRTAPQRREDLERLKSGQLDIVYLSPEKLASLDPRTLDGVEVQLIAVDEAHCASAWGHDFRPSYGRIGKSLDALFPQGRPQLLAVTATATAPVVEDVKHLLGLPGERTLRTWNTSPDRPNIYFGVAGKSAVSPAMVASTGTPAIVYGSTRRSVERAAAELNLHGYRTDYYHAGRTKAERSRVQHAFQVGDLDVITATNAFGMGVDKADVRGVIHLEMPTSLEAYAQEAGRAGRDGLPSMAICRATIDALGVARSFVSMQWPEPDFVQLVWSRLKPWFTARRRGSDAFLPRGCVQGTVAELAILISQELPVHLSPELVGPALRVLVDIGALKSIDIGELPVSVTLLSGADLVRGPRAEPVIQALRDRADSDGNVWGTVRFFEEEVGLDHAYAKSLRMKGAIQVTWARPGRLYQLVGQGDPPLDRPKMLALKQRQYDRLNQTNDFLWQPDCRREYLVGYFGHTVTDRSERCCDRCTDKERARSGYDRRI